jgi:RNA polymerase sigma-70 factor (ECF subfamily)
VPRQDAADVVQDVFLTVCTKIKTFTKDGKPAAFRRWLYSVTRYRVLRYWGHPPGFPIEWDDLDQLPAPEEDSSSAEGGLLILLRRLLELIRPKFKPGTWDAFWKVALEGRSVKEVALELCMTEGAVHVAKSRVLKRLREEAAAQEVTP